MKKIISLFQRNYDGDHLVRPELVPGAEWVLYGRVAIPSRKYDGTCCMIRGGSLFKRYDVKRGKAPPAGFEPAQDPDPVTGHWPGWVPVHHADPADRWHRDALENTIRTRFGVVPPDGTYELIGPKIQGNPEHAAEHVLLPHGADELSDVDPPPNVAEAFDLLRFYLAEHDIEGIVWRHPVSGELVKIKGKDFGLKRGATHLPPMELDGQ